MASAFHASDGLLRRRTQHPAIPSGERSEPAIRERSERPSANVVSGLPLRALLRCTTPQEARVSKHWIALMVAGSMAVVAAAVDLAAARTQSVDAHVAAAKAAAGKDHPNLLARLCAPPAAPAATATPRGGTAPARSAGPPARDTWHVEPAKVFDNLYFVGEREYSAWAVTTSEGIILIDAAFHYSVDEQVVGGLTKLGLDPKTIKYVIISHGHGDHAAGARHLQDRFGARIMASTADWDLMDRDRSSWPKPKRDLVVSDGQRLTLGDTTLTLYLTPGHTLGTISTIIPVRDGRTPHVAAAWGGTAFNWQSGSPTYISAERPAKFWFDSYIASARRFRDIVAKAGADVIIANHTNFDESKRKLPALATRKAGDPHPYVIGTDAVQRYLVVAEECAKAAALR
jgi:metallo-beta-lactamase class B